MEQQPFRPTKLGQAVNATWYTLTYAERVCASLSSVRMSCELRLISLGTTVMPSMKSCGVAGAVFRVVAAWRWHRNAQQSVASGVLQAVTSIERTAAVVSNPRLSVESNTRRISDIERAAAVALSPPQSVTPNAKQQ